MDWADEIAGRLSPMAAQCLGAVCVHQEQCFCAQNIATALRKAKADGMREAINLSDTLPPPSGDVFACGYWGSIMELEKLIRSRANAIEKGTG